MQHDTSLCPCCAEPVSNLSLVDVLDLLDPPEVECRILEVAWEGAGMPVQTERLFDAMYAEDPDGGPSAGVMYQALTATLDRLNRRLIGSGVSVVRARGGRGYCLALAGDDPHTKIVRARPEHASILASALPEDEKSELADVDTDDGADIRSMMKLADVSYSLIVDGVPQAIFGAAFCVGYAIPFLVCRRALSGSALLLQGASVFLERLAKRCGSVVCKIPEDDLSAITGAMRMGFVRAPQHDGPTPGLRFVYQHKGTASV